MFTIKNYHYNNINNNHSWLGTLKKINANTTLYNTLNCYLHMAGPTLKRKETWHV